MRRAGISSVQGVCEEQEGKEKGGEKKEKKNKEKRHICALRVFHV